MRDIAEFIQGITRPICLIVMVSVISVMVYQGREVPTWFWGSFLPFFAWWSTDRTLKHLGERKAKIKGGANEQPK